MCIEYMICVFQSNIYLLSHKFQSFYVLIYSCIYQVIFGLALLNSSNTDLRGFGK